MTWCILVLLLFIIIMCFLCSLNLLLTLFCCNDAVLNVTVDDVQLILITEEI